MDNALAREMYREHILEVYRHPMNKGVLEGATHRHKEHNPLCGDEVVMQVIVKDGLVDDVKFDGTGCAISVASSALLTEAVKGKTVADVLKMEKQDILDLLKIPISAVRLKCALLSLETLQKALGGKP